MNHKRLLPKMIGLTSVLLLLVACVVAQPIPTPVPPTATPTPTPVAAHLLATSIDDIVGTWHGLGSGFLMYHRFNNDGTFQVAFVQDELEDRPSVRGQFWFEGKQLFMREVEVFNVIKCGSEPVIYEAQQLANGNLKLVKVEDECADRINATQREHEPVH